MRLDLAGKIRNTQLPKSKALLPLFEAVVNSLHAIEDRPVRTPEPAICITLEREPIEPLPGMDATPAITSFTVTDNGIGFNDANLDSFFTSDTQHKAGRGGKGLGRFTWLKAFASAEIESHYWDDGCLRRREFEFTPRTDQTAIPTERSEDDAACTVVRLRAMRSPYREACPRAALAIAHQLVEHALPFFLDENCPRVTIVDGEIAHDVNDYFRTTFANKATRHSFEISGRPFKLTGVRLYGAQQTVSHKLLFAAHSREVRSERLDRHIPNLQNARNFEDDFGSFVYLGFVEGDYLNETVNNERTDFSLPSGDDDLFGDLSLDAIRQSCLTKVATDLDPFIRTLNEEKKSVVEEYITREAPQYRPLLKMMAEFIDRIPPGVTGKRLDALLHEVMFEKERQLKEESTRLIEESNKQGLRPADYAAKLNTFIEQSNDFGKASLAQYVVHRKVMLEFLESSLNSDAADGQYNLEEVVHKIIYPMRTTSDEVPYEQQNLWIIDERLSYHEFLTSDVQLKKTPALTNSSKMRPDIQIFNAALSFSDGDVPLKSLVVIEFKRPGRTDYRDKDPIEQVYDLIREVKRGGYKDRHGRVIMVPRDMPCYAYVVCDITLQMVTIAENRSLASTPDQTGYYHYNPSLSTYVEVISYGKLLNDAKRRNRVLFDKLQLPG